jgi:hypothetical protein
MSKPLLERMLGPTNERFIEALGKALPSLGSDELRWRFHFVIGSMIHLLNFDRPLLMPASSRARRGGLERLIPFAAAGIRQGLHESSEDSQ